MRDPSKFSQSPLSIEDIEKIDASGLSTMSRHRIRLLAHCLSFFKEITKNCTSKDLPSKQSLLKWLLEQPSLVNDREFVYVLLEQFLGAERHLENLAIECEISPLELTLDDLINEGLRLNKL